MNQWLFLVFGWLVIYYLLILEPRYEHKAQIKFNETIKENSDKARVMLYRQAFVRNWIMGLILLASLWFSGVSFADVGFRPIEWARVTTYSPGVSALLLVLLVLYLIYFYFIPLVGVYVSLGLRKFVLKIITPMYQLAPRTKTQYTWWIANSLSASVEEFIFRGFVIFFLSYALPALPFWVVIIASLALDATRYKPRWMAVQYVFMTGIIFVAALLAFHSLYAAMLVHMIHDFRTLGVPFYLVRRQQQQNS
jgi:hypothetical protein